ncbi:glycerol kinase GlpK [Sunxiuqinia rutila]|uniref:glycerol kinase GlpK n=1 Tax=Sunxiuqinia rutila TaxID=1397841 RepID=UPI003D366AC5
MNTEREKYILALDLGTSVTSAMVFNHAGEIFSQASKEFEQFFPKPGWIEQDAEELWFSIVSVAQVALRKVGLTGSDLAGIGITNQRETTILWNKESGKPVGNAIVWQDRRTSRICDQLKDKGLQEKIKSKTGLEIDAYFSATKIMWLLDHNAEARELADQEKLAFGTVDSWVLWKFTKGACHYTDVSNASRTMLFNINTLTWDEELLELLNIPSSILPEVRSSSEIYARTHPSIFGCDVPIASLIGDQQAALFGQQCFERGTVKNTYNTGCFILMNTGKEPIFSNHKLITTIAWQIGDEVTYALEGSVFNAGTVIQWLRDVLNLIDSLDEVEELAKSEKDNGGVFIVPSFTGLGAPYWDQYARGTFWGLNMGTTPGHLARAALESIAMRSADVIKAMEADLEMEIPEVRVGGTILNDTMLQFQSDILNLPVVQPVRIEMTLLGAAYLAGLAVGFWENKEELQAQYKIAKQFKCLADPKDIDHVLKYWNRAVNSSLAWLDPMD